MWGIGGDFIFFLLRFIILPDSSFSGAIAAVISLASEEPTGIGPLGIFGSRTLIINSPSRRTSKTSAPPIDSDSVPVGILSLLDICKLSHRGTKSAYLIESPHFMVYVAGRYIKLMK